MIFAKEIITAYYYTHNKFSLQRSFFAARKILIVKLFGYNDVNYKSLYIRYTEGTKVCFILAKVLLVQHLLYTSQVLIKSSQNWVVWYNSEWSCQVLNL